MNINRKDSHGPRGVWATIGTEICLDLLEKADDFCEGINRDTEVVPGLNLSTLIDTLISVEQQTVHFKNSD